MTFRQLISRVKMAFGLVTKGSDYPWDVLSQQVTTSGDRNKVTQPYAQSVWVQQAIKKVSGPIASVPLRFEVGETEIDDERLDEFFRAPAYGMTYADFIEATVGWLSLAGECFWVLDDIWLVNMSNLPFPTAGMTMPKLIVPRPDCMREVVENYELVGWEMRDIYGRRHRLLPEQVIQLKCWNPYDHWRGLAPYESARCATEADYFACKFNRNLWQNNGDRGPIVVNEDTSMDDTQRKQVVDALRLKREASLRGDFRPLFLTGKVKVEDPKVQALDANAVATRLQNRHEIALAFGVPPSMFDVIASYSIGSASDRFLLIEETCKPMGCKIADQLSAIASRLIGAQEVEAYFDWDEHSTMQAVRRERIDAALKLWSTGMPMSVINDYLQLGLAEYEGWDTGYLSYAMAPVENVLEAASIPIQTQEEEEAQAAREQEKLDESKQGGVDGIRRLLAQRNGDGGGAAFQASRPKRHRQIWLAKMAAQRKTERAYESGFNRVLMKARAETLQRLSAMGAGKSGNGSVQRAVGDIVFDLANFKLSLWLVFKTLNRKAMDDAGQQVMDELDVDDPWTTPQVEVLQFNRTRENKIVGAAEEVFRQVNDTINDGLEAGKSVAELTTDVRSAFNGISRGRAKTIARTETGAAYGQGADVAMEQAGVQFKQWVASGLDDVRPAHQEADGQVVKMSESYDVGGEALRFPGDPTGSAGNVINCRCVSIAVPTSEGI